MRRLYKFVVILTIAILMFFSIYSWLPGARASIDSAVGPQVTGTFSAIGASIAPLYTTWVAPWPNHAIAWVTCAFIFAWVFHKGFNRVRTVFVRSADAESGRTVVMREPIQSVAVSSPTPVAVEEKKEEKA